MKNIGILLFWACSFGLFGQKGSIVGHVENNLHETLPGANVQLKGTVRGVETNAKGDFVLKGLKAGT